MRSVAWLVLSALILSIALGDGIFDSSACTFTVPEFKTTFDLARLVRSTDYTGRDRVYDFFLQLCGPAVRPYCRDRGYSACATGPTDKGTQTWSLGTWISLLDPQNPAVGLSILFTDGEKDQCPQNRRFLVEMRIGDTTDSTFTVGEGPVCVFKAVWRVSRDIIVVEPKDCVFVDITSKMAFDFGKLRNLTGDYAGSDGQFPYTLNSCGPVVKSAVCARNNMSVCQFDADGFTGGLGGFFVQPREQISLLSPVDPSMGIVVKFVNGDFCYVAEQRLQRTTYVSFICDPTREDSSTIGVVTDANTCTYRIKHYSKSICPRPATSHELDLAADIDDENQGRMLLI